MPKPEIVEIAPSWQDDLHYLIEAYNLPSVLSAILEELILAKEPNQKHIAIVSDAIDKLMEG